MPKCKDCGTRYRGMDHSVFACEEERAKNAGMPEYARFLLKAESEGRMHIGESTKADLHRMAAR